MALYFLDVREKNITQETKKFLFSHWNISAILSIAHDLNYNTIFVKRDDEDNGD